MALTLQVEVKRCAKGGDLQGVRCPVGGLAGGRTTEGGSKVKFQCRACDGRGGESAGVCTLSDSRNRRKRSHKERASVVDEACYGWSKDGGTPEHTEKTTEQVGARVDECSAIKARSMQANRPGTAEQGMMWDRCWCKPAPLK